MFILLGKRDVLKNCCQNELKTQPAFVVKAIEKWCHLHIVVEWYIIYNGGDCCEIDKKKQILVVLKNAVNCIQRQFCILIH